MVTELGLPLYHCVDVVLMSFLGRADRSSHHRPVAPGPPHSAPAPCHDGRSLPRGHGFCTGTQSLK